MSFCSLLLVLFLFVGKVSNGQTIEKSRSYAESFKVGPETEIEIMNKYGDVHIIPWKVDSVRFEIEVLVIGTKQSRVDKSFDYIEVDFKDSKYYVIAQTLFAGKSSFWNDVSDLTGAIFNSNTKTKIDYTVYLPANATLKVSNKYGNIYTTNHTGTVEFNLSNGNLKAHLLSGPSKITSEFGNINVNTMDEGTLEVSYGECYLEKGGTLNINGKSSEFHIEKAESLNLDSRRDKFYLDQVGKLQGITNFSTIELKDLEDLLGLNTKYGEIEIHRFSDEVSDFNLWSDDTEITLHFIDDKKYMMDFKVDDRTQVMYSAEITDIQSTELGGEENLIRVESTVGSDKTRTIPIVINSRGGLISLKLK